MANTATAIASLNIYPFSGGYYNVKPVKVSIDTTNTGLLVFSPGTNRMACVVGIIASNGLGMDSPFTLSSGDTSTSDYKINVMLSGMLGISNSIDGSILFATRPGEDLYVACGIACEALLYIVEAEHADIRRKP